MNKKNETKLHYAFCYLQSLLNDDQHAQAYTFFKNVVSTESQQVREDERAKLYKKESR